MWTPQREPINNPLLPWTAAIDQPGALHMQHGRALLESRPFLTRIPADDVIVTGSGRYRLVATRDTDRTYAMVYAPAGRTFRVHLDAITGTSVKAWWFNPRDGSAKPAGTFPAKGEHDFTPPDRGEMLDWVLVLDDEGKNYPPPGRR
jgi:hypothetical protein